MKQTTMGRARGVQLCSASEPGEAGITIAGETFVPDAATAYVEFFLSHAFPVYLDVAEPGGEPYRTTIHPATVANSYRSLRGKVMNFAHIMRSYDPERNVRDRMFGTVMAVELSGPDGPLTMPEGGWKVQGDLSLAPGIRAVAALHKNAEGVLNVIDTWQQGKTPFGGTEWTVSMENEATIAEGGFLLKKIEDGRSKLEEARLTELEGLGQTPDDFKALGWIYVPWAAAPDDLRSCLDAGGIIAVARNFLQTDTSPGVEPRPGVTTLFLNGGLNGRLFYFGVALTPLARESHARVGRVMASCGVTTDDGLLTTDKGGQAMAATALTVSCDAIVGFCERLGGKAEN
jgi:hypothetical protein